MINRIMTAFFAVLLFLVALPVRALADDGADVPVDQFLAQVFELIKSFGGMSWTLKIAGIVLLVIASMKVSFLRPLWDKLGQWKAFAAPMLGLLAGILSLQPITLTGVVAYLFAGAGAIVLHELLDAVKAMPWVGAMFKSIIELVQKLLKKPAAK